MASAGWHQKLDFPSRTFSFSMEETRRTNANKREQIPLIVESLVKEGLRIYGVKVSAKTLEDKFLEMTGSGQIV